MSKARAKGTVGENFFLEKLRKLFGPQVERAPLKGIQDQGDYVGVPWLHEAKNTAKPLFQQWARICELKAGRDWVILWKGDLRKAGSGPYVLMPLEKYESLLCRDRNHVDSEGRVHTYSESIYYRADL